MCNQYNDLNDNDLIVACQNKIEAAFVVLYNRYRGYVRMKLNSLAPDLHDLHDDMMQDVFLKVWKSIAALRSPRAFKQWLNQVIRHQFFDTLRKRPASTVVSIDDLMTDADGNEFACREIADKKPQPDLCLELNETIFQVNEALDHLSERFKAPFIMREFYGLHYQDIAVLSNTELGTVKSRIARAKLKMQNHLLALHCA